MFFLKLLRYILGFVSFRAEGGFHERFLNLCSQRNIRLHNVKMNDKSFTAEIQASEYKRLRAVARLSGARLKCLEKHGLVFFLRRHEDRAGLAVGGVFFAVFMCFASLFVWNVETVGSEKLSSLEILLSAKKAGIYPGALSRDIRQTDAANDMITDLNGKLSWVSVNIKGSHAIIEVRDYMERRDDETYCEPCNIVADFDGVLLSVQVHNGTKASFEGSGVKKGDLLISGISENRDTSSIFMEARGVVTAIHNDTVTVKKDLERAVKKYVRKKTVSKLGFFGIRIPLGFFKDGLEYDEFEETAALYFGKVRLPFYILRVTRAYYEKTIEEEAEKSITLLFDEFTDTEYDEHKNTRILSTSIGISENQKQISVCCESECIDYMGVKQKIVFENQEEQK